MTAIEPKTSIQAIKNIISRSNQDGTVILMRMDETNLFYKIDGIASAVWTELGNRTTLQNLITLFSEKYPAHRNKLEKDIPCFINELQKHDLLVKT